MNIRSNMYSAYNDKFGYNILPNAGSHLGAKRTEKSKLKMGAWIRTSEIGAKISAALKGRKMKPEQVEKMRQRKFSEETRAKMRAAHKNKSPETLLKMSLAQKGKKHSPETCAKMAATRRGKKHSLEWCLAISNGLKGKPRSESAKLNIRAAQSKRLASRAANKLKFQLN